MGSVEEMESCGVPCRDQWLETLLQGGLDQIQSTHGEHPYCNLTARLPHPIEDHTEPIYLLCPTLVHNNAWICNVESQFERMGYQTQRCTLVADFTNKQRIVSLLDVQEPFFKNLSETSWKSFQSLVTATPRILWVMPSVELTCQNPDFAIALGVSRTARQEQGLHFGTLQIDEFHAPAAAALVKVTERFFSQLDWQTGLRDHEYEFTLQGARCILHASIGLGWKIDYVGNPYRMLRSKLMLRPTGRWSLFIGVKTNPSLWDQTISRWI